MIDLCFDIHMSDAYILMLIFEKYCLNDPQPQEISICCTSSVLCTVVIHECCLVLKDNSE